VLKITAAHARAGALAAIVPYVDRERQIFAIEEAIRSMSSPDDLARFSKTIIELGHIDLAFQALHRISYPGNRVALLAELVEHMGPEQLRETVVYILEARRQAAAEDIDKFVSRLATRPLDLVWDCWQAVRERLVKQSRAQTLECLAVVVPLLRSIGGTEQLRRVTTATRDVERWWE
jgi:hypothetical protein